MSEVKSAGTTLDNAEKAKISESALKMTECLWELYTGPTKSIQTVESVKTSLKLKYFEQKFLFFRLRSSFDLESANLINIFSYDG